MVHKDILSKILLKMNQECLVKTLPHFHRGQMIPHSNNSKEAHSPGAVTNLFNFKYPAKECLVLILSLLK